jgi:hypothetical protein
MTVVGMPRSGSPISRSMWSGITTRVAHLYRAQAWVAHPRDVGGVDLIVGHRRQSRQFFLLPRGQRLSRPFSSYFPFARRRAHRAFKIVLCPLEHEGQAGGSSAGPRFRSLDFSMQPQFFGVDH